MSVIRYLSAIEVYEAFPEIVEDIVNEALDVPPVAFVEHCLASASPEDAVTFCAYALDRRRAVWWALQCLKTLGFPKEHSEIDALRLAEAWVRDPGEQRRLDALAIGIEGDREQPGVWVALAAGATSGLLIVPGSDFSPPVPRELCARAVRTAILAALATAPVRERRNALTQSIQTFRDLIKQN